MLESRIHVYLRASASERSQRFVPFLLLLDEHDPGRYFNYAVPDDDLEPTPTDIAALVATFRNRFRTPRLEYLPAACAALEPALLAAGFVIEARVPILTCSPDNAVAREPAGVEVRLAPGKTRSGRSPMCRPKRTASPPSPSTTRRGCGGSSTAVVWSLWPWKKHPVSQWGPASSARHTHLIPAVSASWLRSASVRPTAAVESPPPWQQRSPDPHPMLASRRPF